MTNRLSPSRENRNINSHESLVEHGEIIRKKKFLYAIYKDFYLQLRPVGVPKGPIVEIGSGGGFIKKIIPGTVTSDVISGKGIDKVFIAEKMPFKNNSVAAFVMIDVFHHIKDPEKALKEMQRSLKLNGKIIMLEPMNSLWGHFIYKYLHHEYFNPHAKWKTKGKGRMSDANTALPWIIFYRDRSVFCKKFPNLKINKLKGHSPFRYLISGGLTRIQFLPASFYPTVKIIEDHLLAPFGNLMGMFVTIELQKTVG